MGTTARGLRFPEPTDRLNQVDQYIENLALDVDAELAEHDATLASHANTLAGKGNARISSSSGGVVDDGGTQLRFDSGLSFDGTFTYSVFTVDGFGNRVPAPTPKAITPGNGSFYWNNGAMPIGTIVYVNVVDYQ